jgi:hypothetical protein
MPLTDQIPARVNLEPDQSGLVTAAAVAEFFGLTVETVLLWTERGGLREAFPGLYDLADVAGRIRAAARGAR